MPPLIEARAPHAGFGFLWAAPVRSASTIISKVGHGSCNQNGKFRPLGLLRNTRPSLPKRSVPLPRSNSSTSLSSVSVVVVMVSPVRAHLQTKSLIHRISYTPHELWQNGFAESFNSRLRDELLDRELFARISHPQRVRCTSRTITADDNPKPAGLSHLMDLRLGQVTHTGAEAEATRVGK